MDEKYYQISEVSRIVDIPVDTLRFYEKEGVIGPKRDEYNGYRYYDAWDINYLLEYKLYRSLEFSAPEVKTILKNDNLSSRIERLDEQERYFEERQRYYTIFVERNRETLSSIHHISQNLDSFSVCQTEGRWYFRHRRGYHYNRNQAAGSLFKNWMRHYPFLDAAIVVKKENIGSDNEDYEWGFTASDKYVKAVRLLVNAAASAIAPGKALHTVVRAGDKHSYSNALLQKASRWADEHGLVITANALGFLLARTHESDGYARYIDFYIPVLEKS
jgi:DNA-binding transcriptional MerR regulator